MQGSKLKEEEQIIVRGARVHNLKNVTVALPLNKLTVVIHFTRKVNAVMSNRSLPTRASFSKGWTSPMLKRSSASLQQ